MFLHLSVILSTWGVSASGPGGVCHPLGRHPSGQTPLSPGQTPPSWADTPRGRPPWTDTPSSGQTPPCSACWDTVNKRRYASYWNAFLFGLQIYSNMPKMDTKNPYMRCSTGVDPGFPNGEREPSMGEGANIKFYQLFRKIACN